MNQSHISHILIDGYKSLRKCNVELRSLNVLIGANGSGKSNFIGFFHLLNSLFDGRLQECVAECGGPDNLLHFGRETTSQLSAMLIFGQTCYGFALEAAGDTMRFAEERLHDLDHPHQEIGSGHCETRINDYEREIAAVNCQVFHFNDMGARAPVRELHSLHDNGYLKADGRNLAAYLYKLKRDHEPWYSRIIKRVRTIAPYFEDFYLTPDSQDPDCIELRWLERGCARPLQPMLLSDGVLRFACFLAAVHQPDETSPDIILIDEPDVSLHPVAVEIVASILKIAADKMQVFVATHSIELLNKFQLEDIIVADRTDGATSLYRLERDELEEWVKAYSLGEIWKKSIIGGRP